MYASAGLRGRRGELSGLRPDQPGRQQHRTARAWPGDSSRRAEEPPHGGSFVVLLLVAPDGFRATARGTRVAWKWRGGWRAGRERRWTFSYIKMVVRSVQVCLNLCPSEPGLPHGDSYFHEPRGHKVR